MKTSDDLAQLAYQFMLDGGLSPDFSDQEIEQLSHINAPAIRTAQHTDLTKLLWCSIDNDDSLDLDQLTYAEGNNIWVAVADVDSLVKKNSPIDKHAKLNTTSVYTPAKIFPMLPAKLSTNLTSLNEGEERLALVVKIEINTQGEIVNSSTFKAVVHNFAKLTYSAVGGWLEGSLPIPDKVAKTVGLEEQLKTQHTIAQLLKKRRHEAGSLTLASVDPEVSIDSNDEIAIELPPHNFAHQLIEEFMIAANRATARHFKQANLPNLKRVVRIPKYWNRIVQVANSFGEDLPPYPDSKALDAFLVKRKKEDPEAFGDLSLTIIKLLGRGEYVVENDIGRPLGHFALALTDYTHSTAPNRRFPDLITQRQYKANLEGLDPPYSIKELRQLAAHCTFQEDAAMKIERRANKSAAAVLLSHHIGTVYRGIVTGASEKGTWVRLFKPAVEGKVIQGFQGLEVGDRVSVKLKAVDIPKGYIDFVKV